MTQQLVKYHTGLLLGIVRVILKLARREKRKKRGGARSTASSSLLYASQELFPTKCDCLLFCVETFLSNYFFGVQQNLIFFLWKKLCASELYLKLSPEVQQPVCNYNIKKRLLFFQ